MNNTDVNRKEVLLCDAIEKITVTDHLGDLGSWVLIFLYLAVVGEKTNIVERVAEFAILSNKRIIMLSHYRAGWLGF